MFVYCPYWLLTDGVNELNAHANESIFLSFLCRMMHRNDQKYMLLKLIKMQISLLNRFIRKCSFVSIFACLVPSRSLSLGDLSYYYPRSHHSSLALLVCLAPLVSRVPQSPLSLGKAWESLWRRQYLRDVGRQFTQMNAYCLVMNHRKPTQSVCVTDVIRRCYLIVKVLDLPFASPIAIYH